MFILKEIVCMNYVITTRILDFSEDQETLILLMNAYHDKVEKILSDIEAGKNLYIYWQMAAENNNDLYLKLTQDLTDDEKRQLKMKTLIIPEFIHYEVSELVKLEPISVNIKDN